MNLLNASMLTLMSSTLFHTAEAFSPLPRASLPRVSSRVRLVAGRNAVQLRASEEGNDVGLPPLPSQKAALPEENPVTVTSVVESPLAANEEFTVEENEETSYPIDLPSPVLLATSMVLAISSIGSIFELSGGSPQLGFGPTAALAAVGLPLSLFLLYAAILKGGAETEEADKEYMNQSRRRGL